MPEKSFEERSRHAKAEGKPVTVKESDLDLELVEESHHGEKKSRGVVDEQYPPDRSVGHRQPPGHGHTTRPPLPGDAEQVLPPDARRTALPREEAEAQRIREGHPSRMSPSGKKRGEP